MGAEFSVELAPAAAEDLREMGRLTRNLVAQALQDELRTAEPSLITDSESPSGAPEWKVLRIGNYRILFKSSPVGQGEPARLVARIVHQDDLDRAAVDLSEDDRPAEQASGP